MSHGKFKRLYLLLKKKNFRKFSLSQVSFVSYLYKIYKSIY